MPDITTVEVLVEGGITVVEVDTPGPQGPAVNGIASVPGLEDALEALAPKASPAFTGTPTAPTAAPGTSTTQVATTAFVAAALALLVGSAGSALDTLGELADALADDANFAATVTSALAAKAPLASPTFSGTVSLSAGEGTILSLTNSALVSAAGGFALSYDVGAFTNGPGGEENYDDHVFGLGINYALAGAQRIDDTKPAIGFTLESKYYQNGEFGQELQFRHIDVSGTQRRILSCFVPTDGGTGSVQTWRADQFSFNSWGDTQFLVLSLSGAQGIFNLNQSSYFRGNVNNVPLLYQINAAGNAILKLPYLNTQDKLVTEQPILVTSARIDANFATFTPTTANNNDICLRANAPTFAGDFYGLYATGSVNGILSAAVANNDTANAGAHARLLLQVGGVSGGDPFVRFNIPSGQSWSAGSDNSDGDAFKISNSSALGTNDRLIIEAAGTMRFGTHSAIAAETVTGYITIKDIGGTSRKLAVVS